MTIIQTSTISFTIHNNFHHDTVQSYYKHHIRDLGLRWTKYDELHMLITLTSDKLTELQLFGTIPIFAQHNIKVLTKKNELQPLREYLELSLNEAISSSITREGLNNLESNIAFFNKLYINPSS